MFGCIEKLYTCLQSNKENQTRLNQQNNQTIRLEGLISVDQLLSEDYKTELVYLNQLDLNLTIISGKIKKTFCNFIVIKYELKL